jgi:HPt (histidine-containing phosphotransfer) domain-containing protein
MTPIDLTRLRDFSDGTDTGLRDLAALLVTHMEECLLAIRRAVEERDSPAIRSEAHRGAGTFGACGAQPLAALLLEIERLGAAQQVDEAAALLPAVASEVARARAFLEAALEQVRDA